ncbi:unnamed protein product, partial [marine sediment metagenome]
GGAERFRFLLPTYCLGTNAVVLLYDITRFQTLDNIGEWVNIIRDKSGDIPIMLVGILPDDEYIREVSTEEGLKIAKSRNLNGYIECDLKTGKNIEKVFEDLTRMILAQPQFCHKCQKEFTFELFLNHPCYTTGDVLSTGEKKVEFLNRGPLREREKQKFFEKFLKVFEPSIYAKENVEEALKQLALILLFKDKKMGKELERILERVKKLEDYDQEKYPYSVILKLFSGDNDYRRS